MIMTTNELTDTKKDLGNGCMSFIKVGAVVTFRIFVNGNEDVSFWVSDSALDNEAVMTVSQDMFFNAFDIVTCNKIFKALVVRYNAGL